MSQPSDSAWVAPPGGYGTAGGYAGPPGGYGPADGGATLVEGPVPVLVSFAPPAKQNRLTIAFRLLLAIPHLIIVYALGIAAEVVAFIGWWAALFTGSLPDWAHTFITGVVRWQARVSAYTLFLTGSYPPFSLEDESYPVRLVTARARLNRLAVLLRLILLIPAAIVLVLAGYGVAVLSFFCWLIALVAGRLPAALHQALAAVLRFEFRSSGYFFMLTGDYPWWGLFGDPVAAPVAAPETATGAEITPAATDPWRLPLSGAAKGLVSGILVLGLAAAAVVGVADAAGGWGSLGNSSSTVSNARSLVLIEVAQAKLGTSLTNFESAVQACGQLSCATAEDHKEAGALRAFASSVSSAGIPKSAAADAGAVIRDANAAAQSLDKLAASTSVAQYQSEASRSPLQHELESLGLNYNFLNGDLRG